MKPKQAGRSPRLVLSLVAAVLALGSAWIALLFHDYPGSSASITDRAGEMGVVAPPRPQVDWRPAPSPHADASQSIDPWLLPDEPPIPEFDEDGMPLNPDWVPDPENYQPVALLPPVPAALPVEPGAEAPPDPSTYTPPSDNPGGVNGDRPPRE